MFLFKLFYWLFVLLSYDLLMIYHVLKKHVDFCRNSKGFVLTFRVNYLS